MSIAEITEEIDRRTLLKARLCDLADVVVQDEIIARLQSRRTALLQRETTR
jgi:hypothetical protein